MRKQSAIIQSILLSLFLLHAFSIKSFGWEKYVKFLVVPTHNDWKYEVGELAELKIVAYAGGIPMDGVEVNFEAGNDMMPVDMTGKVLFRKGEALVRFGTMQQPGFRFCKLSFRCEGEGYREQIKVAFNPQKIEPTVKMPDDFEEFWKKTVAETRKTSLKSEVKLLPEKSTDKVEVSLLKLIYDKEGHAVYGYLCKPIKPGHYPVLLTPPGAGIKRIEHSLTYAEQGFISLFIDVHGLSPLADNETVKHYCSERENYIFAGLEDRNRYYFKNIFMACVRAVDFLCSLPEADGKNVGVCGGSQGGALTIVTAALDKRITFLSAFYPALCDMTGFLHNRIGGWPKVLSASEQKYLPVSVDVACQTLAYYDVANFARTIKIPGFYSYGYNDNTCPPTTVTAALNTITAPKTIEITPVSAHWSFEETRCKSIEWMKEHVN